MPSVKRVVTTSADGTITITTGDSEGLCEIGAAGEVNEQELLAAVLEYAGERGLIRRRKAAKANGKGKVGRPRKKAEAAALVAEPDGVGGDVVRTDLGQVP